MFRNANQCSRSSKLAGSAPIRSSAIALVLASLVCAASAHATLIQATYQISASNFLGSQLIPPSSPTSTQVSGTYTFTFDTAVEPLQLDIVPDQVTGFQMTDNNGASIGFDATDSGVNVDVFAGGNFITITVGGMVSGVASLVGLSNDFKTVFRVSFTDFSVTSVIQDLGFVTTVDPYYTGPTTVTLLGVSPVPEPAAALLLGLGGLIGIAARRGGGRGTA